MTDLLKDLLNDRADSLPPPQLDVLAMVREGDRRASRRRGMALAAGLAAAVVTAVAIPTLSVNDRDRGRDLQPSAVFAAPQPAYAVGDVVHVGDEQFDVGRRVADLFVTTDGIVFFDDRGTVFATDGTDAPKAIGTADRTFGPLIGDDSRAGWVEYEGARPPAFVVYDQASGELQRADYDTAGEGATEYHPSLFAIDGDAVYLRDARGMVRWDLESGDQTVLGQPQGAEVADVKSGVIAYTLPTEGGSAVFAERDFGAATPLRLSAATALNPSGTKLLGTSSGPSATVIDTTSGETWPVGASAYVTVTPLSWLDDDTYVAVGSTGPDRHDVLTCEVGQGDCTLLEADFAQSSDSWVFSRGYFGSQP